MPVVLGRFRGATVFSHETQKTILYNRKNPFLRRNAKKRFQNEKRLTTHRTTGVTSATERNRAHQTCLIRPPPQIYPSFGNFLLISIHPALYQIAEWSAAHFALEAAGLEFEAAGPEFEFGLHFVGVVGYFVGE